METNVDVGNSNETDFLFEYVGISVRQTLSWYSYTDAQYL